MTRDQSRALALLVVAAVIAACAHTPSREPLASAAPGGSAAAKECHRLVPACSGAAPTYAHDVKPILGAHCFRCHAGDGVAADEHDFSHIETLRAQRVALGSEIRTCAMPPAGEGTLEDGEAAVLLAWGACGGQ